VSVFHDGRGLRPLQVSACSFDQFRYVLDHAAFEGWQDFVIVSHNFELLNPAKTPPGPRGGAPFSPPLRPPGPTR
jgi:hypothetical protein